MNIKKLFISTIIISITTITAISIEPIWQYEYSGRRVDGYVSIIEDNNGRTVAVGNTTSIKHKKSDILISITDDAGNRIKEKNIGSPEDDIAHKAIAAGDFYIIAGTTNSDYGSASGGYDAWVLALDKDLNVSWSITLGGQEDDAFLDIMLNSEKQILVVGHKGLNPIVHTLSLSGGIIRSAKLDRKGYIKTISESTSHYYVAGNDCLDCSDLKTKAYVAQLDKQTLEEVWSKELKNDYFSRSIDSEINGNRLVVLGDVDAVNSPKYQAVIAQFDIKTDPEFIDFKEFGGRWDDMSSSLYYNKLSDQWIITGKSKSFSKSKKETFKAWALILDKDFLELGNVWEGSIHQDGFNDVTITSEGYIVYAGMKDKDAWITCFDRTSTNDSAVNPDDLKIESISFIDDGKDGILNDDEGASINFTISNQGTQSYERVKVCFDLDDIILSQIELPSCYISNTLKPGATEEIIVSIKASSTLQTNTLKLPITINGVNKGEAEIETQEKRYVALSQKEIKSTITTEVSTRLAKLSTTFMLSNSGNSDTGPVKITVSGAPGVTIDSPIEVKGITPGQTTEIEITGQLDYKIIGNSPLIYLNISPTNGDNIKVTETLDATNYLNEVDALIEQEQQEEAEKAEEKRLEQIQLTRANELEKIEALSKVLTDSISAISNNSDQKIALTLKLAEVKAEEAEIFKKDFTSMVEDHTFIKPYILDGYFETFNDFQDIILLLDHDSEVDFGGIKLLLNGTAITEGKEYVDGDLLLDIKEKSNGKMKLEYRNKIRLNKGENLISFEVIYDGQKYTPTNQLRVTKKINKTNLHLISIGIPDATQEEGYKLKYTTKDAEDLVNMFNVPILEDYFNIESKLFNSAANTTTDNIRSYIQKLKKDDYNPEDLLVFYISSHAFYSEDFGSLFVSTSDYDYLSAEASSLRFNNDILDWLKRLPCNVILLLDICHSGHILNESDLEAEESSATAQILSHLEKSNKKGSNVNVVSSSGSGEYSYEIDKLSNSAFMAAIKEAVHDKVYQCSGYELKPDQDMNRSLQLHEFVDFIKERVPCIIDEHKKGRQQNPSAVMTSDLDLKIYPELD